MNVDGSTIEITTDTLNVKAGGIGTTQLADAGPGATGPIGSATVVPIVTIDVKGRVTALGSATITGVAPGGAAGGDLSGTYPNPALSVAKQAEIDGKVPKSLYDANTVLAANTDDTPAAVTMGASTILARLAAGNIKAATIQEVLALGAGTSFPGSPATNDRFYRTDLALQFYYDGTRWLTVNQYRTPMPNTVINSSANGALFQYLTPAQSLDTWIESFIATTYVATTNDGTKYWEYTYQKVTGAGTATSLGVFNTSADTNDVFTTHSVSVGAALGGSATYKLIRVSVAKASTPGNWYLSSTMVYRLIGT